MTDQRDPPILMSDNTPFVHHLELKGRIELKGKAMTETKELRELLAKAIAVGEFGEYQDNPENGVALFDKHADAVLSIVQPMLDAAYARGLEDALDAVIGSNADLCTKPSNAYQHCVAEVRKLIRANKEK